MVSIKEATYVSEQYRRMGDGKIHRIYAPVFEEHEISKAETIVAELGGLTIGSAKELLHKIETYIEQYEIPK